MYKNTTLGGMPLKLEPYYEEEAKNNISSNEAMVAEEPNQQARDVELPAPKFSEFTMMVEEQLQVEDPDNWVEVSTKKNRKEII